MTNFAKKIKTLAIFLHFVVQILILLDILFYFLPLKNHLGAPVEVLWDFLLSALEVVFLGTACLTSTIFGVFASGACVSTISTSISVRNKGFGCLPSHWTCILAAGYNFSLNKLLLRSRTRFGGVTTTTKQLIKNWPTLKNKNKFSPLHSWKS